MSEPLAPDHAAEVIQLVGEEIWRHLTATASKADGTSAEPTPASRASLRAVCKGLWQTSYGFMDEVRNLQLGDYFGTSDPETWNERQQHQQADARALFERMTRSYHLAVALESGGASQLLQLLEEMPLVKGIKSIKIEGM